MATLEALAQQGDPGTMESEEQAGHLKLMTPQQLYELWERQHWQSHEIDFAQDKADWANLSEAEKDYLIWGLSSFFIGEERVTTQFSGLVMSYADEHEESYLTTQQVDEARHMQFFDRFYREVIGLGQDDFEGRLNRVRDEALAGLHELLVEQLREGLVQLLPHALEAPVELLLPEAHHLAVEAVEELHVPRLVHLLGGEVAGLRLALVGHHETGELSGHALLPDEEGRQAPDELLARLGTEPRIVLGVAAQVDRVRGPVLALPQLVELLRVHEPQGAGLLLGAKGSRIALLRELLERRHRYLPVRSAPYGTRKHWLRLNG